MTNDIALIICDVWVGDPEIGHLPIANYFQCGRIVERTIEPILRQFRKNNLPIIHYGNKELWALEIEDDEYSIEHNNRQSELDSVMNKLNPDTVYVTGFHTNHCILELMDYLSDNFDSHIVLVEDATLNFRQPTGRVDKGYPTKLVNETEEFIMEKDWNTTTAEDLLQRLQ